MYDYNDFVHTSQVLRVSTGKVYRVDFVDPDVPYLVIVDEDGKKHTCHASKLEPMDIKNINFS